MSNGSGHSIVLASVISTPSDPYFISLYLGWGSHALVNKNRNERGIPNFFGNASSIHLYNVGEPWKWSPSIPS
jgi:hypothetical protein